MLDFTEQEVLTTSLPELSADTPTESVSLLDTEFANSIVEEWLADSELAAKTMHKLADYRDDVVFVQDEDDDAKVLD